MRGLLFICLLLCACSSGGKKNPVIPERELSMEQRQRIAAIERYRYMRLHPELFSRPKKTAVSTKIGNGPGTDVDYGLAFKQIIPEQQGPPQIDLDSYKIEIGQNIDYFCIIHESDSRFKDKSECKDFGESVVDDCEKRIMEREDINFVTCVKRGLKI